MNEAKITERKKEPGSLKTYVIGFILSILLTLIPYFLVVNHTFGNALLLTTILVLAVAQLLVQLLFFLHMGRERKPRWKMVVFVSFVGIILTVVIGSIWIMQHLNYNMGPQQLDKMIQQGEGF